MSTPLDEPAPRETAAELKKCVRDVLRDEIAYRRERRDQIFTWASTLLVAVIGGTIALTKSQGRGLEYQQQLYLSVAIVGLTAWALIWILYIWHLERQVEDTIKDHLGIPANMTDLVRSGFR